MALVFPSSPTPGQTYVGPNNITYTWDNTLGVWTGSSPAAGGLTAASLAQAAAGTLNTVASTPQTAVPKDASGMTGAAILPGGTAAQRPATSTAGNLRWNSDINYLETYVNATRGYAPLAYVAPFPPTLADLTFSASQTITQSLFYCRNLTINSGVVLTIDSPTLIIYCSGTATINGSVVAKGGGYGGITQAIGQGGATAGGGALGFGPGTITKPYSPGLYLTGSGGSAGYALVTVPGLVFVSSGGAGGGVFGVKALGGITVGATASINCSGTNAAPTVVSTGTTYVVSGGSGGSGGLICLDSGGNLTLTAGATLNVSGGAGAASLGAGVAQSAPGGSGGGGGWIILQSLGTTADASTKSIAGGAKGADAYGAAPWSVGASVGAGYGGAGGGQSANQTGLPGSAGLIVDFGSPF
jgi:hypothetical protein